MCNVRNMSRRRIEIGSEFWLEKPAPQPISDRDGVYTISGRTAIDVILQDILAKRLVRNVYMPAWCCDSMLAPFHDRGIKVELYDISFYGQLNYLKKKKKEPDIFYVNNYFGFENTIDLEIVKFFKAKKVIILYDRTHSFLMGDDTYSDLADYSFASIRKWMRVSGGAIVEGVKNKTLKPCPYLEPKITAMRMKQAYMAGDDSVDKQEYLRLYGEFGHHLADDYCDYEMDDLSYAIYKSSDIATIKNQRRANAQYLHKHLNLQFMSPLTPNACPLFVPVLFESKEERDRVRKRLIEAEIYCPVHWPKPAQIPTDFEANKIYDTELSLICDQRYDISDMQRIIDTILKK